MLTYCMFIFCAKIERLCTPYFKSWLVNTKTCIGLSCTSTVIYIHTQFHPHINIPPLYNFHLLIHMQSQNKLTLGSFSGD